MQLTHIRKITGTLELLSGLHIGGGNTEMHIGGTDNPVIKNPVTNQPYIPGSSIKGKMRSLLEWRAGVVGLTEGSPLGFKHIGKLDGDQLTQGKALLKLFGGAPEGDRDEALLREIGPTRLAFWDCNLDPAWVAEMDKRNLLLTEQKTENAINRIAGVAENPRNTERVPAGARFAFQLTLKVHGDEDLLEELLVGFKLLELTGLGGSGSRGYGKLRFTGLSLQGEDLQTRLDQLSLD
jgi:CRISPR-associated protein Csm3